MNRLSWISACSREGLCGTAGVHKVAGWELQSQAGPGQFEDDRMSMFLASVAAGIWRDRHWSQDQFSHLQRTRLRKLINHACRRVPFYTQRYQAIDPDEFQLCDLRPVTKREMMSAFIDTVSDRAVTLDSAMQTVETGAENGFWHQGRFLASATGGTSGEVGYFLNDRRSWMRQSGLLLARTFRSRLGAASNLTPFLSGQRYRMAFIGTGSGSAICTQIGSEIPSFGRLFLDCQVYSIVDPFSRTVNRLNAFQPRYVHGYATFIQKLAEAQMSGELRIEPRFISLGSEPLTPSRRAIVEQAFPSARVVNQYGCTECPLLANECPDGRMHLNPDCCIVEFQNADGEPVRVGEVSNHILITNLLNLAQPIIRYRVDDMLALTGEVCPCGRSTPVVEVHGRSVDTIWLRKEKQGNRVEFVPHSPLIFETLVHNSSGLTHFQLVHERQNELRLQFVPERGSAPQSVADQLRGVLDRYFRQEGLEGKVHVRIDPVHSLERTGSHKVRAVQSNVPAPRGLKRRA